MRRLSAKLAGLALLLALTWLAPAIAATDIAIELQSQAAVNGPRFTVSQVAHFIEGDERLWQAIASEAVGYAPLAGQEAHLSASALLGLLKERGYDWRCIAVRGAQIVTIQRARQSIAAETIRDTLVAATEERLGVAVVLEEVREIPEVDLPEGQPSITVRFPEKPGTWLPDAVEFYVEGRLAAALPLVQYIRFHVPVVIAPEGIPPRTLVSGTHLGTELQILPPGQELVTHVEQALGLTTRAAVAPGARLKLSRLKVPYDVQRGAQVLLVIAVEGVVLRAQAVALGDAYMGQRVTVERLSDGEKYTGRVCEGPTVVVE